MSKQAVRSPSYPSLSLKSAVEAVGKIDAQYRSSVVDRDDAAKLIGFTTRSGPANQALASLAAYGLLERAGKGDARVTERARAILYPNSQGELADNLREAALSPPLFQQLRERFEYTPAPPEEGVVRYLNRLNFNPNAVRRAAKAFLGTIRYLEEFEVSDSNDIESPDEGESPSSAKIADEPAVIRIGDSVQWESQGVLQFPQPRRVRGISEDGCWAFVEGSESGIPMNELSVKAHEPQAPQARPPTLPLTEALASSGEIEWLRNRVGKSTNVRLLVTGDMGPREIQRLIRLLQTQHDVLLDDEEIVDATNA